MEIINRFAERVVTVSDGPIEDAMRYYFSSTHLAADRAGAALPAALLKEQDQMRGRKVAVVGGASSVDRVVYAPIMGA